MGRRRDPPGSAILGWRREHPVMSRTCPAPHLRGRARTHLTMAVGFLLTTLTVWASGDPRALGLYGLYFILAHLCYE